MKKLVIFFIALFYASVGIASSPVSLQSMQILSQPNGQATIILTATGGTPDAQGRYTYFLGSQIQLAAVATFTNIDGSFYYWLVTDSADGVIIGSVAAAASSALVASATLTTPLVDCSTGFSATSLQLTGLPQGATINYRLIDGLGALVSEGTLAPPYILNVNLSASFFPNYFLTVTINDSPVSNFSIYFPVIGSPMLMDVGFNPSCSGGGDSTISFNVVNGTPPYSACITPAGDPAGCTPVPIVGNSGTVKVAADDTGTYRVRLSDSVGCIALSPAINVTAPSPLTATVTNVIQPTCQQRQGVIDFSVSGGTPGYSFCLAPAENPTDCTLRPLFGNTVRAAFSPGSYIGYFGDSNGCTTNSVPVTLNQPSLSVSLSGVTQPQCNGGSGSVSFAVTGGSSYSACVAPVSNPTDCTLVPIVGNSATLPTGAGVGGSLTVRVVDVSGCAGNSTPFTISQPGVLSVDASITQQVSCNGSSNGQITAVVTGGTAPYSYFLNGNLVITTASSSHTFTGLSSGVPYTVSVNDANSCGLVSAPALTLPQPSVITLEIGTITPPACKSGLGSVVCTAMGGTAPFNACLAQAANPTDCTPEPISGNTAVLEAVPGNYVVFVIDSHGCEANSSPFVIPPQVLTGNTIADFIRNTSCCGQ